MSQTWLESLVEVGTAVERLGGQVRFMNGSGSRFPDDLPTGFRRIVARALRPRTLTPEFTGGDALGPDQWIKLRAQCGAVLTDEIVAVVRHLGTRGYYQWSLPKELPIVKEFAGAEWGNLDWSFDNGIAANQSLQELVKTLLESDPVLDQEWTHSIGILGVPNGDYWAVLSTTESRGKVVYLDHEGAPPFLLGPDLATVMDNWCRIGCVGPESWLLSPFLKPGFGIDGFGPAARRFRSLLSLPG